MTCCTKKLTIPINWEVKMPTVTFFSKNYQTLLNCIVYKEFLQVWDSTFTKRSPTNTTDIITRWLLGQKRIAFTG